MNAKQLSTVAEEGDDVLVTWQDGAQGRYPMVWLRDNCQCTACYNTAVQRRLLLLENLDIDCKPEEMRISEDCMAVDILWEEGHRSSFRAEWLLHRLTNEANMEKIAAMYIPEKKLWGSSMKENMPVFTFNQLLQDEVTQHKWIYALQTHGLCLVKEAPTSPGQLAKIAEMVSHLRVTNCGDTFTVKVELNPLDYVNLSAPLGLHTDMGYYDNQPGMLMLHCIKQVEIKGGDSLLCDGFNVARQLQDIDSDAYDILCKSSVHYSHVGTNDYGLSFHQMSKKPILMLNHEGVLEKITHSNQSRESLSYTPYIPVKAFYRAMKAFNDLLYKPENIVEYKLRDGEIICMDNLRVLHGRNGWEVTGSGARHLEGGYMDWDELRSRGRVLSNILKTI